MPISLVGIYKDCFYPHTQDQGKRDRTLPSNFQMYSDSDTLKGRRDVLIALIRYLTDRNFQNTIKYRATTYYVLSQVYVETYNYLNKDKEASKEIAKAAYEKANQFIQCNQKEHSDICAKKQGIPTGTSSNKIVIHSQSLKVDMISINTDSHDEPEMNVYTIITRGKKTVETFIFQNYKAFIAQYRQQQRECADFMWKVELDRGNTVWIFVNGSNLYNQALMFYNAKCPPLYIPTLADIEKDKSVSNNNAPRVRWLQNVDYKDEQITEGANPGSYVSLRSTINYFQEISKFDNKDLFSEVKNQARFAQNIFKLSVFTSEAARFELIGDFFQNSINAGYKTDVFDRDPNFQQKKYVENLNRFLDFVRTYGAHQKYLPEIIGGKSADYGIITNENLEKMKKVVQSDTDKYQPIFRKITGLSDAKRYSYQEVLRLLKYNPHIKNNN